MMLAWSGSPSDVPVGWALCDGNNGTPDLRGRFILGISNIHLLNQIGGEENHLLTLSEMPSHNHFGVTDYSGDHQHLTGSITPGPHMKGGDGYQFATANQYTGIAGNHFHNVNIGFSGGNQPHNTMPPFYALAYIMRII